MHTINHRQHHQYLLFIKIIIAFMFVMAGSLSAKEISPLFRLEASGLVSDFVVVGNRLYAATDIGSVDIFDLKSGKAVDRIILEPVQVREGEYIAARIYTVDHYQGKTLIVSRGADGYRNVWIYQNYELKKIIGEKEKLFPKEARFIDNNRILMGTFGSDIMLYDTDEKYHKYHRHISDSTMGDVDIGQDGKMAFSDESGAVHIVDIKNGETEKILDKENRDNIYRVAYRHGTVITAGQDRRVGVYLPGGSSYHIDSDFLVYCVALSPDGKTGIYADGTDQDLQLFDLATRTKKDRLVGHHAIVNKITFIGEKLLISSGDERFIYIWKLP